jgi:peptidoglycan hydrolase CwlO-like protein
LETVNVNYKTFENNIDDLEDDLENINKKIDSKKETLETGQDAK